MNLRKIIKHTSNCFHSIEQILTNMLQLSRRVARYPCLSHNAGVKQNKDKKILHDKKRQNRNWLNQKHGH